ncbi:transporter substrate-binding domain-containing protein [Bacillus sp. FJAT-50079]|uniref:transporter substrate-binding domain-containing protein n=1 Tax=Bacillus sp. FJAT-50079 TaxID=2833577 RepID=UPI001BC9343B|nr:transporter substrate-binding domain-containing protein [Bacillus sp. FJAT-50079]MBS4209199.1 transporter substrate-binding domain-containing protein [Bacillus sp. FJAT-50079]
MRKLNKVFLAIVAMATLIMLAACGGGSKNNDSTKKESEEQAQTAWEKIEESGKIIAGTSGTLYPTSFHEKDTDQLTGFEVEILRDVAERLGLEIEFKEMGFDGILTSLNSGMVDLAANDIEVTEERKEKFSFSDPYKFSFGSAVVRKDDLSGIKTLEDLKGKKSAGESTTIYMQISREYGAEEVIYDNATNEQYLRDVSIGRTDVIMNDYYLSSLAVAAFPELNLTIHPDIRYHPNEQAIVVKKGNEDILEKINEVLKDMHEDGTITKLSEQFFGGADVSVKQELDF